jgi:flagellar hook-associated protein 3 FlgL
MISSLALSRVTAFSIASNQKQLVDAQIEQSTGRKADVSRALGYKTSLDIEIRLATDRNTLQVDQNQLTSSELTSIQSGLGSLVAMAQNFSATLIGARNATNGQNIVKQSAQVAFSKLKDILNATQNGKALYAGINTDQPPLADYFSATPPASKTAVDAAFLAQFGFSQSDPAAANITPNQMETFLAGNFGAEFSLVNWTANWSTADTQNRTIRIGDDQTTPIAVSANDLAFRNLTKAIIMVFDLGTGSLNQASFEKIVDRSISFANSAAAEIGNVSSSLGLTQKQLADQNMQLTNRNELLNKQLDQLESVDPYETATRINSLVLQLEASYAITGRLSKLSLLEYI